MKALQEDYSTSVQGLLTNFDESELNRIIGKAEHITIEPGNHVYSQGESSTHFYMVMAGQAELSIIHPDGKQLSICQVGPGGHFGETSLLTHNNHCVTVRALTKLSLLRFDEKSFHLELLSKGSFSQKLCSSLAERLRLTFIMQAKFIHRLSSDNHNDHYLDSSFFVESNASNELPRSPEEEGTRCRPPSSSLAGQIQMAVDQFKEHLMPVLILGEAGTGRRMVAQQIHKFSQVRDGPLLEIDIRSIGVDDIASILLEEDLGMAPSLKPNSTGCFRPRQGGTVVIYNVDQLSPDSQSQLANWFRYTQGKITQTRKPSCRVILISTDRHEKLDGTSQLHPRLLEVVASNQFRVAPLRKHRRDIPKLIRYYLKRYSIQHGKAITQVDKETLGTFMNYSWPGNLSEFASVIQRAVIIAEDNIPLSEHLLAGMPRPEGKWEFNLLRLKLFKNLILSRYFPILPRACIGTFLAILLAVLYFGPDEKDQNIGLTISWTIGWPALIFSFFFFARTWCTICGLSVPGWLAQKMIKPRRSTPAAIKSYSGWIIIFFCIMLFWVEIAWDAYSSPHLTAMIISAITLGSFIFSILFKRRVWCRFLCPLGGINAIFSMPSILELRANTHMCVNRCTDHLCYTGTEENHGCPMFRHPFLVDNNRDCILCGQCVKNCGFSSVHINLRIAPQELWNQQAPRLEDSILVVCLGSILYPFALHQKYPDIAERLAEILWSHFQPYGLVLAETLLFFSLLLIGLAGYGIFSATIARLSERSVKYVSAVLGYGMIPLILGAYMAVHLEIYSAGFYLFVYNVESLFLESFPYVHQRLLSRDAVFLLQFATIGGGGIASIYAIQQILLKLTIPRRRFIQAMTCQVILLSISAILYLCLC